MSELDKNKSNNIKPLKIAVAGVGTVGTSVIKLILSKQALLAKRAGRPLMVTDISVKNIKKPRDFDQSTMVLWGDAAEMARSADYDILVELIGGSQGVALDITKIALGRGRGVVTANKAMLAHHGADLAVLAQQHGAALEFEAAVAAAIPIVKLIKTGLTANSITQICGILNGTCNYILSEMRNKQLDFEQVLADAQAKGYAEADPGFDIDGVDAAHKLSLLSSLAFGVKPDFNAVSTQGVRLITDKDIAFAGELGCCIKLLGIAKINEQGEISQQVAPFMVSLDDPIAAVDGVLNAVEVKGDFSSSILCEGPGAGGDATASAVVADIIDIAANRAGDSFGIPASDLGNLIPLSHDAIEASWYIRLTVTDQPGVVADIADILRNHNISMSSLIQHGKGAQTLVSLVILTHDAVAKAIDSAMTQINALPCVSEKAFLMQMFK
ncbi:MAG: homoserine dehydrogenase [Alphaproteobacteria bacterium]